eukprot:m.163969 g.163969  ORF g.163969 m.163969 type:complete len:445 (+) comp31316_c1_seq1:692-2026(+)
MFELPESAPVLTVVGLMSGTSADGIDAAVMRVQIIKNKLNLKLLKYIEVPWEEQDRNLIFQLMNPDKPMLLRDFGRANILIGERFGRAVQLVVKAWGQPMDSVDVVASHGQTLHHDPPHSSTQVGEPCVISELTSSRTVVSDFRIADIAAGGQGAPLTSTFDVLFLAPPPQSGGHGTHASTCAVRALQNIGGLANVSFVPSTTHTDRTQENEEENLTMTVAFDTGPGNCWIDLAATLHDSTLAYDVDGRVGLQGTVHATLLKDMLAHEYFAKAIPKSTGREEFSQGLFNSFWSRAQEYELSTVDFVATLTQLTAVSMARAYRLAPLHKYLTEVVVSGGGAKNPGLMVAFKHALHQELGRNIIIRSHDDLLKEMCDPQAIPDNLGVDDAKEAMVFGVLGYLAVLGIPGNVSTATGASGQRILGKITPGINFKSINIRQDNSHNEA